MMFGFFAVAGTEMSFVVKHDFRNTGAMMPAQTEFARNARREIQLPVDAFIDISL